MLKKILVAFDGSESAKRAFDLAVEIGGPGRAEIAVLLLSPSRMPARNTKRLCMYFPLDEDFVRAIDQLREQARSNGLALHTRDANGRTADEVITVAIQEKADMIVLGQSGESFVERWILGFASKRIIQRRPCSVVIAS